MRSNKLALSETGALAERGSGAATDFDAANGADTDDAFGAVGVACSQAVNIEIIANVKSDDLKDI